MNVEKFVKNEAKASLSGNWLKAIAAMLTMMLVPLAVLLVIDTASELMGGYDSVGSSLNEQPIKLVFFVLFHLAAVVGLLLLSPVFAGYSKIFCSIAETKKADVGDLFFFFSSADKYKDCVKFMTRIIVSFVAAVIVGELPCLGAYMILGESDNAYIICIILAFVGFIAAILFSHRYIFAIMLYVHGSKSANESLTKGAAISKTNVGQLIKLTITFIGWIFLLILVVPFLYVFPYMTCSYFVSAKYLIERYDKAHQEMSVPYVSPVTPVNSVTDTASSNYNSGLFGTFEKANNMPASFAEPVPENPIQHSQITLDKGGAVDSDL